MQKSAEAYEKKRDKEKPFAVLGRASGGGVLAKRTGYMRRTLD